MTSTKRWIPVACIVSCFFGAGCANRSSYGPYGYPQQYQAYPYGYGQPIQPSPSVGTPQGMIPGQPMQPGSMAPGTVPGLQGMQPGAFAPGQPPVFPQVGAPMAQPGGYYQPPLNSNQPYFGR